MPPTHVPVNPIATLALVAAGGALGASARYGCNLLACALDSRLPAATLVVNITGSLFAGLLLGWSTTRGASHPVLQPLLMTGFLGGFTTFSAFSVEALQLFDAQQPGLAALHVVANVCGALAGVSVGWMLMRPGA